MRRQRGFTLLETVIALAILAVSLTVLLQAQASSLSNAGRSRDLTVATLLARSKMIDIEKHLFHDGFQLNTEDEDGDFNEQGRADIKWHYKISEVELDLSALTSICGGKKGPLPGLPATPAAFSGSTTGGGESNDCESLLGGLGASLGSFTDELGRSMRVVDLKVTWPAGKYTSAMDVRALLSRDDFATEQEGDLQKQINQVTGGNPGALQPGGTTPGGAAPTPTVP